MTSLPETTEPRYCRSLYACKYPLCCYHCDQRPNCPNKCIVVSFESKDGKDCPLSMSKEEWTLKQVFSGADVVEGQT